MKNIDYKIATRNMRFANKIKYGYHCQKCNTWFEDLPEKHPEGIFCPECMRHNYTLVGVCHREKL